MKQKYSPFSVFILLAISATPPAAAQDRSPSAAQLAPDPAVCDDRPVIMIIEGKLRDAARLGRYAKAVRESGLYQKLGGYYIANPRPVALFEGAPPPDRSILIARFPCLANARAFWNSTQYREQIMPLRLNPSAGDFTVTVHLELGQPDYMAGRVGSAAYSEKGKGAQGIPQVTTDAK